MDLKKASAEEMRKSVYANYADFIRLVEFRLEMMISRFVLRLYSAFLSDILYANND